VRLFVSRAQSAQTQFALTEQNAHAIAHICLQLDGMPLAIDWAARLGMLTLEQMVTRLDNVFQLLTGAAHGAPAQQTLRATLDWSHD
jgi:predicted ATPase